MVGSLGWAMQWRRSTGCRGWDRRAAPGQAVILGNKGSTQYLQGGCAMLLWRASVIVRMQTKLVQILFYNKMSKSYKVGDYKISVVFQTDNVMTINAEHIATHEFFANQAAELMRIKKDTVLATLEKKSEKNLHCELEQVLEAEGKVLIISFVVNFDYLPEFKEEVRLDYVSHKVGENNLKIWNCQGEIQELSEVLDNFQKNGFLSLNSDATMQTLLSNYTWQKEVKKGKYLIKGAGTIFDAAGQSNGVKEVVFNLTVPGQKEYTKFYCSVNMNSVYGYFVNFTELLDCEEGTLTLKGGLNNGVGGAFGFGGGLGVGGQVNVKDFSITVCPVLTDCS